MFKPLVRPSDKSAYLKFIFRISQPKHMLCVLKTHVLFNLMVKKTRGPEVLRCSHETESQNILNNIETRLIIFKYISCVGHIPNDAYQDLRTLSLCFDLAMK